MSCKTFQAKRPSSHFPSTVLWNSVLFCVLLSPSWIPGTCSERILFLLPMSSKSMANVFEPLAKGLAERGHQLTIVGPVPFKIKSENVTQMIPVPVDAFIKDYPNPFDIRRHNELYYFPIPFQQKYCYQLFDTPEFANLANEKFDLIIGNVVYHDCLAGIMHKIGSPIIFVASLPIPSPMTELFGTHLPSSFIPIFPLRDISAQLTFKQRTKNFLYNAHFAFMMNTLTRPHLEAWYRERLGQEVPSVVDIYKKQGSMILMNSHFALTNPRPNLPNIVEIGGIHCVPAKPLPKDLEEFASGAKDGFIVFSLGSIVQANHMPESVRAAFVKTFAKLKERVIWKWEKDEGMTDLPSNVKLVKWLPQQDLLGHPNIKLFITHGGLLSTEEAVYHGVPVLGMPIFVDQDANMKQAEILGFGVTGEIMDLTEAKLTPLVRKIIDDPRYKRRASELSVIFRDQLQSPLDRGIYWTEYVLRHKGAYHLKSAAMELNLIQYHCIDVILFLTAVAITVILFMYYVIKLLARLTICIFLSLSSSRSHLPGVQSLKRDGAKKKKHY